jgi:hypothetical protein
MKYLTIICLTLLSQPLLAQTISSKLSGDWTAQCIPEKIKENQIEICKICPVNPDEEATGQVFNVEINFSKESISFSYPTVKRTVAIQYNKKNDHLTFSMDGIAYDFSVLYIDVLSKIILKNQNGTLIYLERKNVMRGE